jgi:cytochrome oxidase assembly protein ShyY1
MYRWLDLPTIADVTRSDPVLVVAAVDEKGSDNPLLYPRARPVDTFMSFYVEPMTHATYAATWGSLAVAGVFMTRRFMIQAGGGKNWAFKGR